MPFRDNVFFEKLANYWIKGMSIDAFIVGDRAWING